MKKRSNEWFRRELEQRTRLEDRIRSLGGTLPRRWPWDDYGELRNLQLIELVEKLEREVSDETAKSTKLPESETGRLRGSTGS